MKLRGRVGIVTGAAQGIGLSIVQTLASEGAIVVGVDRNPTAESVVRDAIEKAGGTGGYFRGDVSNADDVARIVESVIRDFGHIDILVNNAGIGVSKPVDGMTEDEWDLVLNVNLKGQFLYAHYVIPHMKRGGGGVIVNMSSVLGFSALPDNAAYCASKAAVVGFTKSLALEVARDGIRVNAVVPGSIDTPMMWDGLTPEEREEVEPLVADCEPVGRVGKPEEIAKAVLFLTSDDSSFATGAPFFIDGGILAKLAAVR